MHVSHLRLVTFRNFRDEAFDFGPSFNIIIGDNAQGKTNMLEAVSLLSTGRSFRNSEWRDLIQHGACEAVVEACAVHERGQDRLRVMLREPRKMFERNGKGTTTTGFSILGAVLFAPEEILLLRTQPAARRKFIDTLIGRFVASHRTLVKEYEAVVTQRNHLLSEEAFTPEERDRMLAPWDAQLVSHGARLMLARHHWVKKINALLPAHYQEIAEEDEEARFMYEPRAAADALELGEAAVKAALIRELGMRHHDERARRTTLVGPHRDDLGAHISRGMVRRFASQGQHRSFILALKTTEAEIYREELGEHPILLLDDVASELDPGRNARFFAYVRRVPGQVFITTTHRDDVRLESCSDTTTFHITHGRAHKQ